MIQAALSVAALVLLAGFAQADDFSGDPTPVLNLRVQAANVTTDGTGAWAVTFAQPFVSSSPVVSALPINASANPGVCNVATRSATGASGKCWQSAGVTVSVLGSVVNVFSAASEMPVMVIGREPTQ